MVFLHASKKCGDIVLPCEGILIRRCPPLPSPHPSFVYRDGIPGTTVEPMNRLENKRVFERNHKNDDSRVTAQSCKNITQNLQIKRKIHNIK